MTTIEFNVGDYVRVSHDDSVTRLPVKSAVGYRGRILRKGAVAALGSAEKRLLYMVQLEESWQGTHRTPMLPEDVLEPVGEFDGA